MITAFSHGNVVFILLAYCVTASSMVLLNKVALTVFPCASLLSAAQFLTTIGTVYLLKSCGAPVDDFEWERSLPYMAYVVLFVSFIYTNQQVLLHSNVETLLIFRAMTPLTVSFLEYVCLSREVPSSRSFSGFVMIIVGIVWYTLLDRDFQAQGFSAYVWAALYLTAVTIEIVYAKAITHPAKEFKSMLSPTLYSNSFSFLPMLAIGILTREYDQFSAVEWNYSLFAVISLSCLVGAAISYLAWKARQMVSATTFTVVGVANKLLVLLANYVMWEKHATPLAILAVCLSLIGALIVQEAPITQMIPKN